MRRQYPQECGSTPVPCFLSWKQVQLTAALGTHQWLLKVLTRSAIIREMQTKNPVRMGTTKKQGITSVGEDVEQAEPHALLVGMRHAADAVENSLAVPQSVKMESPYDPATPLPGLNSKEWEAGSQMYGHPAWRHYSQQPTLEATRVSINTNG